ncbi:MAG TPA: 1-phosphofructokinase [Ruminococcaceae bacterium]|nr:1-phosphofructokinase [Oscillospiraceae bacterium]
MSKVVAIAMNPSIDKTITIPSLIPYGLNRVNTSRVDPGGKGVNVAKVLNDFGIDVTISGLIAGNQGDALTEFITKLGIEIDFLKIDGETRTNLKIVDESVNKTTEINETGFLVSSEAIEQFNKKYAELIKQSTLVVLSGSLPPGVPNDFYAKCILTAKTNGVKVLLDADGQALSEGIKAVPFAVKPNIHELETLYNCKLENISEIVDAAKKLIELGISIVIISMGADGAIVLDKNEAFKVDTWDIPVKSTVGAGDSMVGALAYAIINNCSLYEIAKITTAAGTVTASKEGTQLCTLNEVLQSLDNVKITKL